MPYGHDVPQGYDKADNDWYVEPSWCVEALTDNISLTTKVLDPACGCGTIPNALSKMGHTVEGTDLVYRGYGSGGKDFLDRRAITGDIVTNPPYKLAETFVRHSLSIAKKGSCLCFLMQSKFLYSQKRYPLFYDFPPYMIIHLSRRPSMPPGTLLEKEGESIRKGGKIDFCWVVWVKDSVSTGTLTEWSLPK